MMFGFGFEGNSTSLTYDAINENYISGAIGIATNSSSTIIFDHRYIYINFPETRVYTNQFDRLYVMHIVHQSILSLDL